MYLQLKEYLPRSAVTVSERETTKGDNDNLVIWSWININITSIIFLYKFPLVLKLISLANYTSKQ